MDETLVHYYNSIMSYSRTFPEVEIRRIIGHLVTGLVEIHSRGLIHRKINFGNVYIKNGTFKLGDFAQARALKKDSQNNLTEYVYDRGYRPPEVIMKLGYNQSADVFSLGCLMIELYNGKPPFRPGDEIDHITQQV